MALLSFMEVLGLHLVLKIQNKTGLPKKYARSPKLNNINNLLRYGKIIKRMEFKHFSNHASLMGNSV